VAIWSRLQGWLFGGAVATAAADGIRPVLEPVKQKAWKANALRVLEPGTVAELVAQAIVDIGEATEEVERSGFNANRLQALVHLAQVAPAIADARSLRRRGVIGLDELHHVYAKARIESTFWGDLDVLLQSLLSPAEVANAVQQGHLPNDGILPDVSAGTTPAEGAVAPATPDGQPPSHVPLTQIDLDPIAEAAGAGVELDRLKVMANLAGLPPGPEALLAMWNRGLIDESSVDAGIREGHMKTKWAGSFKRMRWAVLSAQEAASARLRTWITAEESYAIGALTGHTKDQMDLMFLNRGRPASPTQMWRAWARGIVGPRGVPTAFEDHAKAIAISDIRPEYAELLWGIRFNYPSLFQLNRLVDAGTVDPATAATWAKYNLYAPEVVQALEAAWGQSGTAGGKQETKAELADEYAGGFITQAEYGAALQQLGYAGEALQLELELGDARRAKAYREKVIDAIHQAYLEHEIGTTEASSDLATVNVTGQAATQLLSLWDLERRYTRTRLTEAQVVKAYGKGLLEQADALARLADFGLSPDDAAVRLAEG